MKCSSATTMMMAMPIMIKWLYDLSDRYVDICIPKYPMMMS